ncbi:MAG: type II toxin-antitoxin system HipA family toxin [Burkholderiaceae bacterium]
MGRRSHARSLSIWANGERVGTWTLPSRGPVELRYDPAWQASPAGRPLSLSLPFTGTRPLQGERVQNYFENLLPDSEPIRRRIATRFKTRGIDAFELLQAIGRDCVGAVQLLGEDDIPGNVERIEAEALTDEDVERLLARIGTDAAPGERASHDDLRISIAGAQEKTALLWHEGRWMRPHGATPTTHILKLPLGLVGQRRADFSTSVENEWLCMQLLAEFGLPVPATVVLRFGNQKVLGIERFDRELHPSGTWWMRLPQEDFCQARGVPPHLKYESDGGPGLADIAGVLVGSVRAEHDLATVLKAQLLFWMLAAPDGHAKNFSLRLLPQGRYALTPLYDVMSIWPVEGDGGAQYSWHKAGLAMGLVGKHKHYRLRDVQRRHFNITAARYFHRDSAEDLIRDVLERVPGAIDGVAARLPKEFPERVATGILEGLRKSARMLERMPSV